jgi:hypothetical protein
MKPVATTAALLCAQGTPNAVNCVVEAFCLSCLSFHEKEHPKPSARVDISNSSGKKTA